MVPKPVTDCVGLVTSAGARYVGGVSVDAVHEGAVQLDNGVTIDCDLVLAATGVRPQSDLAEAAGLRVEDSRVVVGADMRTSAPDVFAAGDVALAFNPTAGRHIKIEHWQDAVDQGAVAGTGASGEEGAVGRRARILDDDRRSHRQVPRVGRRL